MPCNKREPGTGCGALEGLNRIHAILGWSEKCVATYPGDMANALYALEAQVRVRGAQGRERTIPINDFHRLPGDAPERDNNLEHGELIVAIDLPKSSFAKNYYYLKVRDRASYAFALVAVAAALELDGGRIRQARVVLGGVAHKPWRSPEAESALSGKPASEETFLRAAEAALREAKPLAHNAYKVELGKRAIVRTLMRASRLA
jgi:xanthine dehydrogenase YagS FAD-binding subunit